MIALKYWKRKSVSSELAMVIATNQPHFAHYLPTEVVLKSPEDLPRLMQALYWRLEAKDVRLVTGLTETEWPDLVPYKRYKTHNYAYLLQQHSDRGDDGHVDYQLTGYFLLTQEDLAKALKDQSEEIHPPETHCESCGITSPTSQWVPDAPGGWPRCPHCQYI